MRKFLIAAFLLMATNFLAPAMVFWNLGNDTNQTDPGTGVPWSAVAKIYDPTNSNISGSAVYLGNGYLLTANHVFTGPNTNYHTNNYSRVTFDNTNSYTIDPAFGTYGIQVTNVDMKVFKLTLEPSGVSAVNLLTTTNEAFGSSATIVGWGVGRYPGTALESTNVPWDTNNASNTSAKRWGVNAPKGAGTNPYDFLVTVAGASGPGFNPDGLGDAEASVTLYDSGAGMFQNISSNWYLIGLTTSTDTYNTAIYGDDTIDTNNIGSGDYDYFARISSYHEEITALIPEPSTCALLAFSAAALGIPFLRRRR